MRHSLTAFLRLAPLCTVLFLLGQLQTARADVTWTGDVDPADPTTWTSGMDGYVGKTADGTLDITGGGAVSNNLGHIGDESGSTGVVTVDGVGSTWTNSYNLYVGESGSGTLNITNGGAVSNWSGAIGLHSGSTGIVTIDGAGSTWTTNSFNLNVGNSGNGTLNITNGGAVSNLHGAIGLHSGSTGVVTIDGAGSTWANSGTLYVGLSGSGTLNITNGGAVSNSGSYINSGGYIGHYSGSTGVVTVDGAGSTWTNSSELYVGHSGSGMLNIANGGAVSNDRGTIGRNSGSTGIVTVDGAGSTWTNSGRIYVGHFGSGTLNVTNGGAVSNYYKGVIGDGFGSTGVVTVDGAGSTWANSGTLYVGNSGSGTLNITNGGAVTVAGDTWIDRYSSSKGSTLLLGIGPDGTGLLDIGGDLAIGETSTLLMSFDGGAIPTVGDDFTLITFDGSLIGTFTNEPTPTLAGDYLLSWAVNYNANDITLEVVSSFLAADFDHDGNIDGADYLVWQSSFGSTTNLAADGNADGVVDAADYTVWRDKFGSSASSQVSQTTVPEPSTLLLLLASVATVLSVKRNAL